MQVGKMQNNISFGYLGLGPSGGIIWWPSSSSSDSSSGSSYYTEDEEPTIVRDAFRDSRDTFEDARGTFKDARGSQVVQEVKCALKSAERGGFKALG